MHIQYVLKSSTRTFKLSLSAVTQCNTFHHWENKCVDTCTCMWLQHLLCHKWYFHILQIHLHIISVACELQKVFLKYFIICIFASILLLCVMLCRRLEYQVAISSDQPSLQDNLSCLSISIHCVWTALEELHPELKPYMYAQLTMSFDANDDVGILIESR